MDERFQEGVGALDVVLVVYSGRLWVWGEFGCLWSFSGGLGLFSVEISVVNRKVYIQYL